MDPNQNPQSQPGQQPQPEFTPQPVQPEAYAPVGQPQAQPQQPLQQPMQQQPVQPMAPTAPQPVAVDPAMQAQPQQPVQQPMPTAAFPQPAAAPAAPAAFQGPAAAVPVKKPFPTGLVLKLTGSLVALIVLVVGGWFAYATFFGGIPLKEYQGDDYSMLVPKDYNKKDDSFGDGIAFEKPDTKSDEESSVTISSIELNDTYLKRDKMIEILDKNITEDKLKEDYDDEGELTSLKINKNAKIGGVEARRITASANKDGKKVGSVDIAYILGEEKLYVVAVMAHATEPGLAQSSGKIIESFKIK